jgi:predicted dehydrogenase
VSIDLRIGLVGLGKIARDQHLPSIEATAGAQLIAVATRSTTLDGVRNFHSLEELLEGEPRINAVVLCQPPQARFQAAWRALSAGKHVFLEKPPGATLSEVEALIELARAQGVTLFASWHSRYAAAVEAARLWLAGRTLRQLSIAWKENVRHWHPGQDWIWQAGGFGVFDPGINALSILTEIVADPIVLTGATLDVPSNRAAPIAAQLSMQTAGGAPIRAEFDFRQTGRQTWDISIETEDGELLLGEGGNKLFINGLAQAAAPEGEYRALYRRFGELVESGMSDVDVSPLRLVADAFLRGHYQATEAFLD